MIQTEGEHELVLGNKQLLSAFFVVVVLLGVFFTMGYFVGKNTATSGFNAGQTAANGGARPDAAGKAVDSGSSTASASPIPDSTTAAPDPNPTATSAPAPAIEAKPAPPPREEPTETVKASESGSDKMAQPTSEQKYLQVSAIRRPDADNMVKVLRERGFPALLGESSKQGLYRVLVGPFKTTTELGHAKAELKSKGFESIVAK
jgi:cell division septation protein DedD